MTIEQKTCLPVRANNNERARNNERTSSQSKPQCSAAEEVWSEGQRRGPKAEKEKSRAASAEDRKKKKEEEAKLLPPVVTAKKTAPEEREDREMFWNATADDAPQEEEEVVVAAVEERIPIIARRGSRVEVLGWCSRARAGVRPVVEAGASGSTRATESVEGESGEREAVLPWVNYRLLPDYPVQSPTGWSTTSSSSASSSSSSSLNGGYGTFNDDPDDPLSSEPDSDSDPGDTDPLLPPKEEPITWLSLPEKSQLFVLALCRLSEPLTRTSVNSYLYYFLESFHPPGTPAPSPGTISRQAGILASSFALAQCVTGVFWGRLSDRIGRKPCILIGLAGTIVSVIGFGFSENLAMALTFRMLEGFLNGNVGILRTMVAEIIVEKKYQSRAFLILPMCSNIGIIAGPILGGLLANPVVGFPGLFGGVKWMDRWRYALPNLVSAGFLLASWVLGLFFMKETLESKKHSPDIGIKLWKSLTHIFHNIYHAIAGTPRPLTPSADLKGNCSPIRSPTPDVEAHLSPTPDSRPPPFLSIFTPQIISTLISFTILPLHNSTFMHLWSIFLSTPVSPTPPSSPLHFTGGLGLSASQVGLAMGYIGFIGIAAQLFLYPPLQARLGAARAFQLSCMVFPLTYLLTPFLSRLPSTSAPGEPAAGVWVWAGISTVLMLQVLARTFALPGSVILLTNSVEREGVMGTVQGFGSALASASRAVGPVMGGMLYPVGLDLGVVGLVYWGMAGVAAVGSWCAWLLKEGKGIGAEEVGTEEEEECLLGEESDDGRSEDGRRRRMHEGGRNGAGVR